MTRDITMIFAVLASVFSLAFGFYKNIEANNAKAFAYQQVYRVLNVVQQSNITPFQRATIADTALGALSTPAPVIDLSRSSADSGSGGEVCTPPQRETCTALADDLAQANALCAKASGAACTKADQLHRDIISGACISCFDR